MINYLGLLHSAALCGVDTTPDPLPSLEFLRRLFGQLVCEKRLLSACSVAKQYALRAVPSKATLLLEELALVLGSARSGKNSKLHDSRLDNILLEADVACELVDWWKHGNRSKECWSKLDSAAQLYKRAGHAYGTSMIQLYRVQLGLARSAKQRKRQREDVETIKELFQRLRYLEGVRQTLVTLHELARAERDLELVLALEMEMRENGRARGSFLDRFQSSLNLKYWTRSSSVTVEMLQTCEALYREIKDVEAPGIRLLLTNDLVNGYNSMGDTTRAAYWQALAEQEPMVVPREQQFLLGRDPFFQALAEQTSPPLDPDLELSELNRELERIEGYIDPELIPPKDLRFGIMKVTLMIDYYMMQGGFRGFDDCEVRVNACMESADRLIDVLPEDEKLHWRAQIVLRHARTLFSRASGLPPDRIPAIVEAVLEATKKFEEALEMFRRAGSRYEQAMVLQNLHTCYRMSWQFQGRQPRSPLFGKAVQALEEAAKTLTTHDTIVSQRLNRSWLLDIWYDGLVHHVEHGKMRLHRKLSGFGIIYAIGRLAGLWRWLPRRLRSLWPVFFSTPYEEAVKTLEETEKLIDDQRRDLSSLPSQEAIQAKQHLRKNEHITKVFQTAPVIFGLVGQNKLLWEFIQRSKARSVSDLLGIGDNIPADLVVRINANPHATSLLETEKALGRHMEKTAGMENFTARRQLDQHRERMRKNAELAELLDLREGKPVDWERLTKIKTLDTPAKSLATWFVDWITAEGSIFILIVSDQREEYHISQVDMTVDAVREWTNKHMGDNKRPLKKPLNTDESLPALIQLRPLVSPITDIVPEGDRLVLCPTGALHRVPLHAAITNGEVEDDEDEWKRWQSLMERNPLVYTSSMTIYEQTMVRRAARRSHIHSSTHTAVLRGAVLGVYEDPDPEATNWTSERDQVYASCKSISSLMNWDLPQCGNNVGHAQFRNALAADMVYFCGHFDHESANVLEHGVILGRGDANTAADVQDSNRDEIGQPPKDRVFTTSDFFGITTAAAPTTANASNTVSPGPSTTSPAKIRASHVSLIACGSARQAIQPEGDEPLGVLTALLYAGATSVTGTMWPTGVGVGRGFSNRFYSALKEAQTAAENTSRVGDGDGDGDGSMREIDLAVLLQTTARKMKRSPETSRPYSWAGFVLHGSWCL